MRQQYLGLTRWRIVQAILSHVPRVTHGAGYTRTTIPAPAFDALRVFWAQHRRSAFAEWEIANLQRVITMTVEFINAKDMESIAVQTAVMHERKSGRGTLGKCTSRFRRPI